MDMNNSALAVEDIYKSFFNNPVLKGVSFNVEHGTILGFLGGNGAGKSTLMKIINGVYFKDSGQIQVDGKDVEIQNARDAQDLGIAMVFQELSLIPTMTVLQNLFLNTEPKKGIQIDEKECRRRAREAFESFGITDIDLQSVVGDLPIGQQQLVEIIKALLKETQVLILDEPTASLSQTEVQLLFEFLERLKAKGIAIIFITHNMPEIMQICDRAVILRDGVVVLDESIKDTSIQKMIEAMLGRKLENERHIRQNPVDYQAEPLLQVKSLESRDGRVKKVDFEIYPGEVVGIAGLMGSGRTELIKSIIGLNKVADGKVFLRNRDITNGKPWNLAKNGLFMIPEDRRRTGIVGGHSVFMNLFIPSWHRFTKLSRINDKKASTKAKELVDKVDIVTTGIDQELRYLSGGNQQKVVFGKSIYTEPDILMMDDPTVGVDVETKQSILGIIAGIADMGKGVLLVSSEFDQLVNICDRILIMKNGELIDEKKNDHSPAMEAALTLAVQS